MVVCMAACVCVYVITHDTKTFLYGGLRPVFTQEQCLYQSDDRTANYGYSFTGSILHRLQG